MSDRKAGGLVALAVLLLLAGLRQQKDRDGFHNAPDGVAVKGAAEYTDPNVIHPSEQQHRTNQSTQWQAENSIARAQKSLAFIATFAAIGALVFAGLTYCSTLDVVRYTRDQAVAARTQVDLSRSGQLPFLFIQSVSTNVDDWRHGFAKDGGPTAFLTWKFRLNDLGATPAVIESIKASVVISNCWPAFQTKRIETTHCKKVVGTPSPAYIGDFIDLMNEEIPVGTVAISGKTDGEVYISTNDSRHRPMEGADKILTKEWDTIVKLAMAKTIDGYLVGDVTYKDVFGGSHNLGFGLSLDLISGAVSVVPSDAYNYRDKADSERMR